MRDLCADNSDVRLSEKRLDESPVVGEAVIILSGDDQMVKQLYIHQRSCLFYLLCDAVVPSHWGCCFPKGDYDISPVLMPVSLLPFS